MGIRPAIVALILFAAIKTGKLSILDKTTALVAFATTLILLTTTIHPIVVILVGAMTGIGLAKKKRFIPKVNELKETDLDYFRGAGI